MSAKETATIPYGAAVIQLEWDRQLLKQFENVHHAILGLVASKQLASISSSDATYKLYVLQGQTTAVSSPKSPIVKLLACRPLYFEHGTMHLRG